MTLSTDKRKYDVINLDDDDDDDDHNNNDNGEVVNNNKKGNYNGIINQIVQSKRYIYSSPPTPPPPPPLPSLPLLSPPNKRPHVNTTSSTPPSPYSIPPTTKPKYNDHKQPVPNNNNFTSPKSKDNIYVSSPQISPPPVNTRFYNNLPLINLISPIKVSQPPTLPLPTTTTTTTKTTSPPPTSITSPLSKGGSPLTPPKENIDIKNNHNNTIIILDDDYDYEQSLLDVIDVDQVIINDEENAFNNNKNKSKENKSRYDVNDIQEQRSIIDADLQKDYSFTLKDIDVWKGVLFNMIKRNQRFSRLMDLLVACQEAKDIYIKKRHLSICLLRMSFIHMRMEHKFLSIPKVLVKLIEKEKINFKVNETSGDTFKRRDIGKDVEEFVIRILSCSQQLKCTSIILSGYDDSPNPFKPIPTTSTTSTTSTAHTQKINKISDNNNTNNKSKKKNKNKTSNDNMNKNIQHHQQHQQKRIKKGKKQQHQQQYPNNNNHLNHYKRKKDKLARKLEKRLQQLEESVFKKQAEREKIKKSRSEIISIEDDDTNDEFDSDHSNSSNNKSPSSNLSNDYYIISDSSDSEEPQPPQDMDLPTTTTTTTTTTTNSNGIPISNSGEERENNFNYNYNNSFSPGSQMNQFNTFHQVNQQPNQQLWQQQQMQFSQLKQQYLELQKQQPLLQQPQNQNQQQQSYWNHLYQNHHHQNGYHPQQPNQKIIRGKEFKFDIDEMITVEFDQLNELKNILPFIEKNNYLIVPTDPAFPTVDFFVWVAKGRILYACQVTTGSTHKNHYSVSPIKKKIERLFNPQAAEFVWFATPRLHINKSMSDHYFIDIDKSFL